MMVETLENKLALARHAALILQQALGAAPVRIEKINAGVMTVKFAAQLPAGRRYVVRFYPPNRCETVRYEPDILRRCRDAGLPTPNVICDSRNGPETPLQYMVYAMIDGAPLSRSYSSLTAESRAEIARTIVTWLETLRQIHVTGYGDLVDGTAALYSSWQDFLHESFAQGIESARRHSLLEPETIDRLQATVPKIRNAKLETPSVLTWGDITTENIIVDDDNRPVGLLDFEGALAGDYLLNLGYCLARFHQNPFFESLVRAWPVEPAAPQWFRIKLYAILRAMRIVKFAHQPLPTGHPRMPLERLLPGFAWALDNILQT